MNNGLERAKRRKNLFYERMKFRKLFIIGLNLIIAFAICGQQAISNTIGMEFVQVPAGEFVMGKFEPTVSRMVAWGSNEPVNEGVYQEGLKLARKDALPGFKVIISMPFFIGKYEVTQAQWRQVMGFNPSYFQQAKVSDSADLHPVENVNWKTVSRFIKKLNKLEKGKAHYRLPTEREWEYAARAGKTDDISWAEIQVTAVIAMKSTSEVGEKKPNAWGLFDMLGNVWEWVNDFYNEKIFADAIPSNSGKQHVLKGGPFYGDVKNATYMTHAGGPGSGYDAGFRLIKEDTANEK